MQGLVQAQRSWWSFNFNVCNSQVRNKSKSRCVIQASSSSDPSVSTSSSSNNYGLRSLNSYETKTLEWATGGALDFRGAAEPLVTVPLAVGKRIYMVRHGLSSWNEENRIQGSSDLSVLTEQGVIQAEMCRHALSKIKFERCYASPISRAKSSAEVIWSGREEPLIYLDNLREANLLFLEGMKNEDARKQFPELFKAWREDPANFNVNGVYPVVNIWSRAKKTWNDILSGPGETVLVVTHKTILRALICTALGLPPQRLRCIDINNSSITRFTVNEEGEPMLDSLNLTAHLHAKDVFYLN